jgi:tetratricopeptide (TPR) repeat protein
MRDAAPDATARAQELIFQAWESPPPRALALARRALEVSADCADAYCILAQSARSLPEAIELYRQGVAAGERALGAEAFVTDVGHFWGLLETRPYMRARAGLAASLWAADARAEAVEHYRDMLRLNPGDNQGIRYVLLGCLLQTKAWAEAERLYAAHEDDPMATWAYARALLDFQRLGDAPAARKALSKALAANPHVPAYVLGKKKIPSTLPDYHGLGDENEAILYAADHQPAWGVVPGALAWMREATT